MLLERINEKQRAARVQTVYRWIQRKPGLDRDWVLACMKKWGVGPAEARGYVKEARELLMQDLLRSKEEHRCDALAFYRSVILDPNASTVDKIRARERIDKLLGLEQPVKAEVEMSVRRSDIPVDSLPLEVRKRILELVHDHSEGRALGERSAG
jgi:hypothetical protein